MKDGGFSLKGGSNTLLIVLAVVAAFLAAFNAFVALQQVSDLARMTGYQVGPSDRGNVTLIIPLNIQIQFSPNLINWSNGTVIPIYNHANLTTSPVNSQAARVVQGTWDWNTGCSQCGSGKDTGLVVSNVGNVNVSINLTANKNSSDMFGALGATMPAGFQWNITANGTGAPDSVCGAAYRIVPVVWGLFREVNKSGDIVCRNLSWTPNINSLRIDFKWIIPKDAARTSDYNTYASSITAVAEATSS